MWDLIVSVPDHCLSFYFDLPGTHYDVKTFKGEVKSEAHVYIGSRWGYQKSLQM